jgi:hypothetical protein
MTAFRRMMSAALIVSTLALGLPGPSYAGIVTTDAAMAAAQRDRVAGMLDRADVRSQLEALGVKPADVQARVEALSDDEVAQLAGRMGELPAGADGGIIGALIFVFLVLLITDILGLTKIFPFTRSVR